MTQKDTDGADNSARKPTRADWEMHHAVIHDSFIRLFKKLQRPPTQNEIAIDTGLSRTTIQRHVRKISLGDAVPGFKLRLERVMHGLTNKAEDGHPEAVKLWMQIVMGWTEKTGAATSDFKVKVTFE